MCVCVRCVCTCVCVHVCVHVCACVCVCACILGSSYQHVRGDEGGLCVDQRLLGEGGPCSPPGVAGRWGEEWRSGLRYVPHVGHGGDGGCGRTRGGQP